MLPAVSRRSAIRPRARRAFLVYLVVCAFGCAGLGVTSPNYLTDYAALPEPGYVHVVVEIPAGTSEKWEVSEDGRSLAWESVGGVPRVIRYLAYPANYGMVPRTLLAESNGGDGDPLDVFLLGTAVERGSVQLARPIGVLALRDEGERDDKLIAVPTTGPLAGVRDLRSLEREFPGVLEILETWLHHYDGVGTIELTDRGGPEVALQLVKEASAAFEAQDVAAAHRPRTATR